MAMLSVRKMIILRAWKKEALGAIDKIISFSQSGLRLTRRPLVNINFVSTFFSLLSQSYQRQKLV